MPFCGENDIVCDDGGNDIVCDDNFSGKDIVKDNEIAIANEIILPKPVLTDKLSITQPPFQK